MPSSDVCAPEASQDDDYNIIVRAKINAEKFKPISSLYKASVFNFDDAVVVTIVNVSHAPPRDLGKRSAGESHA